MKKKTCFLRVLALALFLAFSFAFAGCDHGDDSAISTPTTSTPTGDGPPPIANMTITVKCTNCLWSPFLLQKNWKSYVMILCLR